MISIVIPNYNGKHLLEVCLNAIRDQVYKDFECIIVDNGSKDDSIHYIKTKYEEVRIIALDKNYGFSYAVNRGIEAANGEYIALLNNDTKVDPYWLEALYLSINKDEKIFSVGSKLLKFQDENIIDDAGEEYTILGWAYQLGAGQPITKYTKPYDVFANCGGAVLYRKAIFKEIGLFEEQFFAYMEDIDIGYRARIHGYRNIYEPNAKVLHIGSATSGSQYNEFKARLVGRNNVWVPYKNMPLIQLIVNLPFLVIGFIIKIIFFIKKGLGKAYILGIKEGIMTCHVLKKEKYESKYLGQYFKIEYLLIKNTFKIFKEKLR